MASGEPHQFGCGGAQRWFLEPQLTARRNPDFQAAGFAVAERRQRHIDPMCHIVITKFDEVTWRFAAITFNHERIGGARADVLA